MPLNVNQLPLNGTLTRKRSMVRVHLGLPCLSTIYQDPFRHHSAEVPRTSDSIQATGEQSGSNPMCSVVSRGNCVCQRESRAGSFSGTNIGACTASAALRLSSSCNDLLQRAGDFLVSNGASRSP